MSGWPVELSVAIPIALSAAIYLRGWSILRLRLPDRFDVRHALAYTGALSLLVFALSRPFEILAHRSLSAHMVQHLLLTLVVAPLVWIGAPVAPLFVGLPRAIRAKVLALTRHRLVQWILHPIVGWVGFALSFWIWHVPALYDLTLEADAWHHVEHASFLGTALLFWRPVILAWPARMSWPRWSMIPYLALAMFQGMPLAAILTLSDRTLYRGYPSLDDQALAGAIMWLPGSFPLLVPLLRTVAQLSANPVTVVRRWGLRRRGRRESASQRQRRSDPHRSAESPSVSAAPVPGRDVRPQPGADRVADSRDPETTAQRDRDPRRSDGHRHRAAMRARRLAGP
jgi:cytochrome c oxidase assembly factor CtaG